MNAIDPLMNHPIQARWDPQIRHDSAMRKIERAITTAHGHPDVKFTREDLARVAELMGYKLKAKPVNPE